MTLLTEIADLVLARTCVSCNEPGPPLCSACVMTARRGAGRTGRIAFGTRYQGSGRAAVLAHKRQRVRSLAAPLGLLVADAVQRLATHPCALALVPIPAHRSSLQRNGQDTVRAIADAACVHLDAVGYSVQVHRALRRTEDRPSLAGAGRRERAVLVAGAFAVRTIPQVPIVCVDDVITTGATVREAMRMFPGPAVLGAAAVCGANPRSD